MGNMICSQNIQENEAAGELMAPA